MPSITTLNRFPVKGMLAHTNGPFPFEIHKATGVLDDRRFAVARKPDQKTEWAPKGHFYCGMNTPQMANLRNGSIAIGRELTIALKLTELPTVIDTDGRFNMTDTKGPSVSLLNLATVRAFEQFLRDEKVLTVSQTLDPRRFRMNVHIDTWPPFAELDLVDAFPGTREIKLGNLRFRVDDACERCKATHANPNTGKYDLNITPTSDGPGLLDAFMAKYRPSYRSPHRGRPTVMGILLVPLDNGFLHLGDELTIP